MKNKMIIIGYIVTYTVLYFVIFFIFLTSNQSFGALKRVIILNGILNLFVYLIDIKKLFHLYPLVFLVTSYISIESYMNYMYWKRIVLNIKEIFYPFTHGINGYLFTVSFSLITWMVLLLGKLFIKSKKI